MNTYLAGFDLDKVTALVTALAALVAAVGSVVAVVYTHGNKAKLNQVHDVVNGQSAIVAEAARVAGIKEGIAQEQERNASSGGPPNV